MVSRGTRVRDKREKGERDGRVDTLPLHVVQAYQCALEAMALRDTAFVVLRQRSPYAVADEVDSTSRCKVQPLACAEACYITAYAMLKSAELAKVMIV